ncbi:hypothetical protein BRM3_02380 [Brachybacterium huguangmaarense]|uniref:Uncharacterized protein n=1 Tax=Brachybacterium huguangmaarense TaxID=1652028 RepID=A0ABY6G272_9MICO|nr:hypothetical protein [Brachybacterium huguangmaarense]UYG17300.1 hypothetical protein BRM3_02380 [Brachybacterium huguangmaarense]
MPSRPPLHDLPAPPRLPADPPAVPSEILLESRAELTARLRRGFWKPGLVLLALWLLLAIGYIHSASPTLWAFTPLLLATGGVPLTAVLSLVGFSLGGIVLLLVLVPIVGTALSFALLPVASAAAARVNPRRHLTAVGARRAVSTRIARVLVLPPVAAIALLLLAVLCQAPLQWKDLSYGAIAGLAGGVGLTWVASAIVRRLLDVPALLRPRDGEVTRSGKFREDAIAQDRRHLPPSGPVDPGPAVLRSLFVTVRSLVTWWGPVLLPTMWLAFGIGDAAVFFTRISSSLDTTIRTGLPWPTYAIGFLLLALLLAAMALAPLVAMRLAEPQRALVTDLRTAPTWAQRAAVNPWEVAVCRTTAAIDTIAMGAATVLLAIGLGVAGTLDPMAWTWITIDLVVLTPLTYPAVLRGMQGGLRDVVYGPAGRYMRRRTPFALIAPPIGTRTELAADPFVRARMRRLGQDETVKPAGGGSAGAAAAGAGALGADGSLPDFSAGRSPRTRPPAAARDDIPEDVTELEGR